MKRLLLLLLLAVPGVCFGDSDLAWNYRISSGVWTVDMSDQGEYVATGTFTSTAAGYGHGIYLFDKSGKLLWEYDTEDVVWSVSMAGDGSYIAAGSKDKNIYLFDTSGALLWKYKVDDTVWSVAISEDGEYIAAGSYDNNVYLFDKTGALLWKYKTDDIVLSTSISSDGSYIAAGSYDNNVYLFDKTGALLWKYKTDDIVLSTSISSDGSYIAAGSYDNHIYYFEKSGGLLWKYRTNNVLFATSISTNGDFVAAGSYDNNVYLFDKNGNPLFKYETGDEVWGVAISSDGSYIAAASKDSNVYFLSASGDLLGEYSTGGFVSSVAISADGDYAVAGSYDRSISFFRISPLAPIERKAPKLEATKDVSEPSIKSGEDITVSIELKNIGDDTAKIVEFSDTLPRGFTLIEGELSQMTELGPGESKTYSYVVTFNEEINEQREVEFPPLGVSYIDIVGNQYTAESSASYVFLIPESSVLRAISYRFRVGTVILSVLDKLPGGAPVSNIGDFREKVGAALSGILKLAFVLLVLLVSLTLIKMATTGRKTRRKIDKAEILMKIRKEVGAVEPDSTRTTPEYFDQPSMRTQQGRAVKRRFKGFGLFGKSMYRKEKVDLLKNLKNEVKESSDVGVQNAPEEKKPQKKSIFNIISKPREVKATYRKEKIDLLKSLKKEVRK